ncbi:type II toxin-antitoxin system VapC family toxin [Edaphobacter sp.]|uniref:type II toxin-antitoxin system VapC family toxin n=1 Tax=Edaphobacter sp. TaxID=1934404 RepID=UPI002DB9C187|nr:type II toxin-antitoxin system VapC family toxin [Edaphobacter sp.]HEU5341456.1 type II toxin-antitoxin system VapC family toxin [Edaphobacter sp.]
MPTEHWAAVRANPQPDVDLANLLSYGHILQLGPLPHHHGDPFDRLLIAQAIAESLPILTADRHFKAYDVKVIW